VSCDPCSVEKAKHNFFEILSRVVTFYTVKETPNCTLRSILLPFIKCDVISVYIMQGYGQVVKLVNTSYVWTFM